MCYHDYLKTCACIYINYLILFAQVLLGMKRDLANGTVASQMTVLQMMLNLHSQYPTKEAAFLSETRADVLRLLKT